ncbi:MAG: hypothetical protein WC441_02260 [Patescibacteria group bacterium]
MLHFLRRRHERFYQKNRWHLVLDLSALLIIIILAICLVVWQRYRPVFDFSLVPRTDLWQKAPMTVRLYTEQASTIRPGEKINLKLDYQNGASDLQAFNLEFLSLNDKYSFVPANFSLDNLPAGQSAEGIIIPIEARGPFIPGDKIGWQAALEYKGQGQLFRDFQVLPDLQVASDLKVQAKIYYHSPQGDQLGAGPLPPQVGLPTNYWVDLSLADFSLDLENFVLSLQLPAKVDFTGKKSLLSGSLKYNETNRRMIWAIPAFSAATNARAGFEIQLVPGEEDMDKVLDLLTGIRYSAFDKISNSEISGRLNNLDTNLRFDNLNQGQGRVAQ